MPRLAARGRALPLLLATLLLLSTGTQCARAPLAARADEPSVAAPAVADGPSANGTALSPAATRQLLQRVVPPPRDEPDLVRRFRQACGTPVQQLVPLSRDEQVGDSRTFWVQDQSTPQPRYFQVQATLRHASEHLLFYVQDGVNVNRDALVSTAATFEQKTFPVLRQYFGDPPVEPRITVFTGRVPGVGGYFNSSDLYPHDVNPYSNERVMVYMNLDSYAPGGNGFSATLAHEVQHFVHWLVHPQQDSWVNEGASELAMTLAGYDQAAAARPFLNAPETQLNAWGETPEQMLPYYGGGYLILSYFAQRLGGYDQVKQLIATPGIGVETFDTYLAQRGGTRFEDLFRDFVIANLLNDRSLADGRFGYDRVTQRARIQESFSTFPATSANGVRPFATRYVELQPGGGGTSGGRAAGTLDLSFDAAGQTRLYGAPPHSGQAQWWGNAADEMESTLTREVDLSGVSQATLRFSTWFNIERDYDYAGVAVSTDGGCSWQTVPGTHTTDYDPIGQNLGNGLTGRSGGDAPVWVDESMDLSPYAGQKILLRFFYVTDQSYHGSGVAFDDISIPEIGFADDGESDTGWDARGFIRSVNAASLDWAAQAVVFDDSGTRVVQLPLVRDATGRYHGTLSVPGFGGAVRRVVVALSPMVPVTLEPADYTLTANVR